MASAVWQEACGGHIIHNTMAFSARLGPGYTFGTHVIMEVGLGSAVVVWIFEGSGRRTSAGIFAQTPSSSQW